MYQKEVVDYPVLDGMVNDLAKCEAMTVISSAEGTCFFTLVGADQQERHARLFIESLRSFGGRLSHCPVWVFCSNPTHVPGTYRDLEDVHLVPLAIEDELCYYFATKVYACARAEEMAGPSVRSLVWLSPECLIVNPPTLFDLRPTFDAAFRTVHHKNVGSLAKEPLDDFWKAIYRTVGLDDAPFTIESFIDLQQIRPYFNTHCFSIHPVRGICRVWWEYFKSMISDQTFQSRSCRDELHQIFLHQAILSAVVAKELDREQIRLLSPEYSYPLHMHHQIPGTRRAQTLNGLVCLVYEETRPVDAIEVREPLRSWLIEHMPI